MTLRSFVLCLSALSLGCGVSGQSALHTEEKPSNEPFSITLEGAIAKVKSGNFTFDDIETVHAAERQDVIPSLEGQFERSQDLSHKGMLASALMMLGDKDDKYWDFLLKRAMDAVDDDAPFFLRVDENGKFVTTEPSPAFLQWAADNHLTTEQAVDRVWFDDPGAIGDIGQADDPRAIPTLRRALLSQNFLIQAAAAQGLAYMGDRDSISLIIDACKRSPKGASVIIAEPLVYFDDSEAQDAVDLYLPKEYAAEARKARATGETPFGSKAWR
jgi:hypothetical protein